MEIECTQKLECTQELCYTQTEKTDPEQIGFLGIMGNKYPVKRGPNKIGRDPQTCRIHLDLNSISRQHAVINVLSLSDIMLMDLDSSNKTKVQGKTLQPYIPHCLKNGDTVQFGAIFGVFMLLEDDNDLPMTQAIDLPCTPALPKQMSRLGAPVLVPESPEVSDMDDSFVMPSQPKKSSEFKSPMNKFIKPSNKTVAIQPMGSKTIDNAYWTAAKKSDSFNFQLDDSGSSFNDSNVSNKSNKVVEDSNDNIHEMETQQPFKANDSTDSIYTANTQIHPSPSIHCMETQPPVLDIHMQETQQAPEIHALDTQNIPDTIHNCETQAPIIDKLPDVCKLEDQKDFQIDLISANKENDNSLDNIFNAETQAFPAEKGPVEAIKSEQLNKNVDESSKSRDDSHEEIEFEDLNTQSFHDDFESQPIIPAGNVSPQIERIEHIEVNVNKIRRDSGSSTDCEDMEIMPNQKLSTDIGMLPKQAQVDSKDEKKVNDVNSLPTQKNVDDIEMLPTQKIVSNDDDDLTDCEDEIVDEVKELKASPEIDFEDMATQVIGDDVIQAELNKTTDQTDGPSKVSFEELPKQIITDDSKDENFEDMPTQIIVDEEQVDKPNEEVYSEEMISPFKVPFPTPLKTKKTPTKASTPKPASTSCVDVDADDPNYYAATQDIFNDLCTQRVSSPDASKQISSNKNEKGDDDDLVPCSVEDYEMGDRFRHIDSDLSPLKKIESRSSDSKVNLEKVTTLTALKTPKMLKIMNMDLPDSQEIKTSVTLKHNSITDSSSDTETEVSDQDTYGKKRKPRVNAKQNLSKKLEELPSRVITRVRKPTLKVRESDEASKKSKTILRSIVLADSDDNIDADIINENISRLKSKTGKKKDKGKESDQKKISDESSRNENKKDKTMEEPNGKGRSSRSKTKKSEESKSKVDDHKDNEEKQVRSTRNSRNKKDNDNKESKKGKEQKESKSRSDSKHRNDSKSRSDSKSRNNSKTRSSTRSKSKENKTNTSKSAEKTSGKSRTPETEIRRSSRHKSNTKEVSPKHENSTVYLSSESSTESPKNLKRPAANELEVPSPKRTRSLPSSKNSSLTCSASTSVCSTPVRVDTQYVLFTAFSNDDVRSKLEKLGAVLVTDVMSCTVLVTLQIKRTFKLLCALGLGRPIVGPEWVQACADTNTVVDPWLYLIKDATAEKRFHFSLEKTLKGKRNFLKGYRVSATPSVLPTAQEMKLIVECSGGQWKAEGPNWICVTSSADKSLWGALRRRGATLVSTEFILGGVLRQHADVAGTAFGTCAVAETILYQLVPHLHPQNLRIDLMRRRMLILKMTQTIRGCGCGNRYSQHP